MNRKTFTFLVVSNRRGQTHSLSISAAWLKALGFFSAILLVVIVAASFDYVGLLLEVSETKRLRAENLLLRQQFEVVEGKLGSLEDNLERVKNNWAKLKLITNIEDSDRTTKLAMGPSSRVAQDLMTYEEDWVERPPTAEYLEKESVFFREPPLDVSKREVANLGVRDYASLSIRIERGIRESQLREQGVISLYDTLVERQALLSSTPNIKPSSGWFTSKFGYRDDPFTGKPVMHAGLDLSGSPGTPVWAPADGVVSYVGYEAGYGKLVAIDHGYGVRTRYGHLSQMYVHLGQKVGRRDVIAAIGSTGRSSGPHLHYEVRVNGIPVDPINYILDE